LARREDIALKVFFTWHAGDAPVDDRGFQARFAWDIPLTEGYEFEAVPNVAREPGTHHFLGLRNPALASRVDAWAPDAVHVTGWAGQSHLALLHRLRSGAVPVLFRGDSHLLDERRQGLRWSAKRAFLRQVYRWPAGLLFAGQANRAYFEAFGVGEERLFHCPHSIDVARFAEPADALEREAAEWRGSLGLADRLVLLFAGKFEPRKRPLELMRAVRDLGGDDIALVMAGSGELSDDVTAFAGERPDLFRVLPFQNQTRMPLVYRLGDVLVLPSAYGETWGLAVNEALACGRPVVVSDRVGCAPDVVDASSGWVFSGDNLSDLRAVIRRMADERGVVTAMRESAARRAWLFDIGRTESALVAALRKVCPTWT
jgi:glycosyltransferase involved in cell wall biosynthesis